MDDIGEDRHLDTRAASLGLYRTKVLRFAVDQDDPPAALLRIAAQRFIERLTNHRAGCLLDAGPYPLVGRTRPLGVDFVSVACTALIGRLLRGSYVEARHRIYVPSYAYLWRECIGRDLRTSIFELANEGTPQYFYDFDSNGDIDDTRTPLSHASLLVGLLDEEFRTSMQAGR